MILRVMSRGVECGMNGIEEEGRTNLENTKTPHLSHCPVIGYRIVPTGTVPSTDGMPPASRISRKLQPHLILIKNGYVFCTNYY